MKSKIRTIQSIWLTKYTQTNYKDTVEKLGVTLGQFDVV